MMAHTPTSFSRCLPPTRTPRAPCIELPDGSIDTHVHVFDSRYPLSVQRGYEPPDSRLEHLTVMHKAIGIDRVVLTQASIYGIDNQAMLDACDALNSEAPGRARSVVAVASSVTDQELTDMHARGARGVRLNTDNAGGMPIGWEELPVLCERIAALGWHIESPELLRLLVGSRTVDLPASYCAIAMPVAKVAAFDLRARKQGFSGWG